MEDKGTKEQSLPKFLKNRGCNFFGKTACKSAFRIFYLGLGYYIFPKDSTIDNFASGLPLVGNLPLVNYYPFTQ